jgi:hypothetical protein
VPYQGTYFPYPHDSVAPYNCSFGQYLTVNCIDGTTPVAQCRDSLAQAQSLVGRSDSNWTSKRTGNGVRPQTSTLFRLLWRVKDAYQNILFSDQVYPYTFVWLCTSDGGATYNPVGCRFNNSTTQVHEIAGEIPAAWDGLAGFDTDPRAGRITAEGFVDKFGTLAPGCTVPNEMCFPIKMQAAFTGSYSSVLVYTDNKSTNVVPKNPERDVYFCGGVVCDAASPGAVPSGWIGPGN